MNLEQELYRRRNVAMRQAPDSLSEQVGKWSAVGDIVGGVLTGRPLSGIATGLAKAKAASWLKEQQTTDALIASAFKNFKGMPAPIVMPAQPEIRGLLGPATPAIGPPMGASVESTGLPPAWQRNVWEGRGAPKLLPPSTLPFSASGVAVPDMAGQIRQGVNREMAGPKLLNKGTAPFTQGISVPEILGRPSRTTGYMLEPPREPGPGGATILPMPGDVLPLDVGTMGYARGSTPMPYPPGKIGAGAPPQEIPPPVDWRNAERLPLGKSPTPPAPGATADGLMPPSPAEGAPAMPISRKPGPPPLAEVPPVDAATAIEKHVAGRESGPFAKAVAEHGQAEQRFVELLNAEKPDKAALKVAAAEVDRLAEPLKGQIGWLSTTAEEIAADAGKTITGKPLDLRVPPPVQ